MSSQGVVDAKEQRLQGEVEHLKQQLDHAMAELREGINRVKPDYQLRDTVEAEKKEAARMKALTINLNQELTQQQAGLAQEKARVDQLYG